MRISQEHLDRIIQHAKDEFPRECCGIIEGDGDLVTNIYPMKNHSDDPIAFWANSSEQFLIESKIKANKHQVLAIYHSHPTDYSYMSTTDQIFAQKRLASFTVVVGMKDGVDVKCFQLEANKAYVYWLEPIEVI